MACDSCFGSEADCFEDSFATAFAVFCWNLLVPAGLLVLSWALPRQRRFAALRALVSVLAPVAVVVLYLVFSALVQWPA
ncbi:hypothetical protein [Streptomyces sp. RKND-216]|uniref:hypothetical protein n=1 Tax=Streptomyces sp. RKND-216 TaxID=2562581 RepID=UPI001FF7C397|nr:hypothetical protein [Streptomyces sp. RKND-216]